MKQLYAFLTLVFLFVIQSPADTLRFTLLNGVVSYVAEDGRRREIQVGKKCADLWVSPDESVIAFVAIDNGTPPKADYEHDNPFIEQSTIYIAQRSAHFKPVRVDLRPILIEGRRWQVVRQPIISPNFQTVYFSVPFTMTSWKLMSASLRTGKGSLIGDADSYCVIWGGKYSGSLLMQGRRTYGDPRDPATHPTYPYFLRSDSGVLTRIAGEDQYSFDQFAAGWSRDHGGTCQTAILGTNAGK